MTSWHDIENLQNLTDLKFTGIDLTKQSLQKLINSEIQSGTPSHRILLGGFSQGAAMALYTGLNYPQKLAGLVCLSGYLPKF
jgi:phospholipase/carboxylesterase